MNADSMPKDIHTIFSKQNQQNDFLENLLDSTSDMIVVFDTELKILMLNKSCEKNFMVKDGEVRGKNLFDVFPYVKGSQSHQDLLRAIAGETVMNKIKQSSDKRFFVENQVIPLKDEEGKVYAVMAIGRNITTQVNTSNAVIGTDNSLAEQNTALQQRNSLIENILNSSLDIIMVLNRERELVAINKFAREILEPFSKDLVGTRMEDILPHIKNTDIWDKFYEAIGGNRVVIKEYKSLVNDKYWEINLSPLFKNNVVDGVIVICHDISRLMNTKNELEHSNKSLRQTIEELGLSEERYHRMVEEVQDYAIILLDPEGNIQNWNKGAERIKGYSSREVMGKNFIIFYTEEDRATDLPKRLLKEAAANGRADYEGWRVSKGGRLFWGSILLTALRGNKGELVGFSKVTRDLTIKKLADDSLKKYAELLVQKNADLEKLNKELQAFAYVASHDLQEPLRKIQFFANLILHKEANNLSDTGKDHFRRMQEASKRMQTLIEDLLSFSRTNDGEKIFEKLDLKKIVNEVVYEMREAILEKDAKIYVGEIPEAEIIPFQFRQLIQNLISNALKFSNKVMSPQVEIFSSTVNISEMRDVLPLNNREYFKLTVKDNGIGFEPEYKEKIFDIFQRLHGKHEYQGTGIGLTICKKIAENHNGLIVAEGMLGEGAIFMVYLPITQTQH